MNLKYTTFEDLDPAPTVAALAALPVATGYVPEYLGRGLVPINLDALRTKTPVPTSDFTRLAEIMGVDLKKYPLFLRAHPLDRMGMGSFAAHQVGQTPAGVYLPSTSNLAVAAHELGHATPRTLGSRLIQGLSRRARIAPAIGAGLLDPDSTAAKLMPWISAALSLPTLHEEARASLRARKALQAMGRTGAKTLIRPWSRYGVQAAGLALGIEGIRRLKGALQPEKRAHLSTLTVKEASAYARGMQCALKDLGFPKAAVDVCCVRTHTTSLRQSYEPQTR